MTENKHLLARILTEVIAQEFVIGKMCGVCLPASLILHNHLKKFNSQIKYGLLKYDSLMTPIHFWVEIEGVIYDPTPLILKKLSPEYKNADVKLFKYYENEEIISNPDDLKMLNTYHNLSFTEYIKNAPKNLRNIKDKIDIRAEKILHKKTPS